MTDLLFRHDPYLSDAPATVTAHTAEGGVVLDRSIFYPAGGGQPGDNGRITWPGGTMEIATTLRGEGAAIVLVPAAPMALPPLGAPIRQNLDWPRRHRLMRMHTALHLLSVVIPLPVTGGSIGETRSRLDFDMSAPPGDAAEIEEALHALVDADLPVSEAWITGAELDANPALVKTMSVAPPRGAGQIRLVQIGEGPPWTDRQPCGGTHVARTGEIGWLRLGKIEKKGRQNRRVYLHLDS